jgi:hypothetical protein
VWLLHFSLFRADALVIVESQPHPDISPPKDRSRFRQAYTQLNSPKPEA